MIRASSGAELCASHDNPNPRPSDCAIATDHTYQGDVDLSARVVVGEPVQKSALQWSVPYNVKDDAGNEATTVWRDVVVQEVDLQTVESKIRAEVKKEQEVEKEKAIRNAIREEKIKWEKEQATRTTSNSRTNNRRSSSQKSCPACPVCDCPKEGGTGPQINRENCQEYCDNVSRSCTLSDESISYALLFWLEDVLSPSLAPYVVFGLIAMTAWYVTKTVMTFLFSSRAYHSYDYEDYGAGNDDILLRQPVQQPKTPQQRQMPTTPGAFSPPGQVYSGVAASTPASATANAFFSPPAGSQMGGMGSPPPPPSNSLLRNAPGTPGSVGQREDGDIYNDIYGTPSIITPSRNGQFRRRTNQYS